MIFETERKVKDSIEKGFFLTLYKGCLLPLNNAHQPISVNFIPFITLQLDAKPFYWSLWGNYVSFFHILVIFNHKYPYNYL